MTTKSVMYAPEKNFFLICLACSGYDQVECLQLFSEIEIKVLQRHTQCVSITLDCIKKKSLMRVIVIYHAIIFCDATVFGN